MKKIMMIREINYFEFLKAGNKKTIQSQNIFFRV